MSKHLLRFSSINVSLHATCNKHFNSSGPFNVVHRSYYEFPKPFPNAALQKNHSVAHNPLMIEISRSILQGSVWLLIACSIISNSSVMRIDKDVYVVAALAFSRAMDNYNSQDFKRPLDNLSLMLIVNTWRCMYISYFVALKSLQKLLRETVRFWKKMFFFKRVKVQIAIPSSSTVSEK